MMEMGNPTRYGKNGALGKALVAAAAAALLLLFPWEGCFGADWASSVMNSDEACPAVRIPGTGGAGNESGNGANEAGNEEPVSGLPLQARQAETLPDESAALHLTAVNLPETKHRPGSLEISLQISAGSHFKTAGILLEYDYSKLRPIAWDKEQTPIPVPDLSEIREAAEREEPGSTAAAPAGTIEEAALAWRRAAVLETKAPGWVSAKPALSYRSGDKGYLYLGAEQIRAVPTEKDTAAATVRFAYAKGVIPSKDYVASALNFVETRADMKVAYASPVRGSALYQSEDPETGETRIYSHKALLRTESGSVREDTGVPAGEKLAAGAINVFTYVQEGKTVDVRPTETKDYVSVTFYDWDDTLLGTRVVAKGEGSLIDPNLPENRKEYVNEDGTAKYTDGELAAMGVAPLAPEGNVLTGGQDPEGAAVTVINKAGYRYAGWVDHSGTSTPDVGIGAAAGQTIEGNGQELAALEGLTENRVLRAAYDEDSFQIGSTFRRRFYTVEHSDFTECGEGFIKTMITVKRDQHSRRSENGVVLAITLRPYMLGESQVHIALAGKDIETYWIVMPVGANATYAKDNGISYMVQNADQESLSEYVDIPAAEMTVR